MPLPPRPPKQPLKHDGIGPSFPLIIRDNHGIPTNLALYIRNKDEKRGVGNSRKNTEEKEKHSERAKE